MQIKLYQTDDAANVINKTLTGERIIDVALRRDFNLFSPEVVLKMANAGEALAFNYAIIPDLERHYFVESVENVGAKRWRYILSVDALETFKSDILSSAARFSKAVEAGDFGNLTLNKTGDVETTIVESSIALEPSSDYIVSLTDWKR